LRRCAAVAAAYDRRWFSNTVGGALSRWQQFSSVLALSK
jgi:hypothetical protein